MRKALFSFAVGEQAPLLDISGPRFLSYARRHGYDLFLPDASYFRGWKREPSWWKLFMMTDLFESRGHYDVVLWCDADVMIVDESRDIAEEIDEYGEDWWLGLVVHTTVLHGQMPNCGVMVARAGFALRVAPRLLSDHRPYRCWEQGALMRHMGVEDPERYPVTLPDAKSFPWKEIGFEWNVIKADVRSGIVTPRFVHCTGSRRVDDKMAQMRALECL